MNQRWGLWVVALGLFGGVGPLAGEAPSRPAFIIDAIILAVPAESAADMVLKPDGAPRTGHPAAVETLQVAREVHIGKLVLSLNPDGTLLYNGRPQPPAVAEVEVLIQPRIIVEAGGTAVVQSGARLQYFERRIDGAFDLQATPQGESPGVEYEVVVRPADGQKVNLDCQLKLVLLEGREKIPDVELEVGRPKLSVHQFKAGISVALGEWALVSSQFLSEKSSRRGDVLLILLRVRAKEAGGNG